MYHQTNPKRHEHHVESGLTIEHRSRFCPKQRNETKTSDRQLLDHAIGQALAQAQRTQKHAHKKTHKHTHTHAHTRTHTRF